MIENPYRAARLDRGLSQAKLAELAQISRLSVLRLEQGLFAEPLGKVSLALGLSHSQVSRQYRQFQHYTRVHAKHPEIRPTDNFISWRQRNWPSQAAFCVAYCVSQASLHRYESLLTSIMPGQLREALLDAGYTSKDVNRLARRNAAIA
jgi:DNA-binding XRE family transcriptional regulator